MCPPIDRIGRVGLHEPQLGLYVVEATSMVPLPLRFAGAVTCANASAAKVIMKRTGSLIPLCLPCAHYFRVHSSTLGPPKAPRGLAPKI